MTPPRLMLVTDPAFGDEVIVRCVEQVARAVPRGTFCVQLRDKRRLRESLRVFAWRLRTVTRAVGATLVLNGQPALARDVGADGVHLGRAGGTVSAARAVFPRAWISVAAHSDDEVRKAAADGADAVLVSPVFGTRAPGSLGIPKEGRGLGAVRAARALAGRASVYALGGVDAGNAAACRAAGADGVAVMRALLAAEAPARAARAIHDVVARRW